jgi:hypothetical protein
MKGYWAFLLLVLIEFSCNVNEKTVSAVGLGFNEKRAEIGLPLLDTAWTLVINDEDVLKWMNPRKADTCVFISKLVRISDGKLKREENLFEGKKMFKTVDGSFREYLYVSCDFYPEHNKVMLTYTYAGVGAEFRKEVTKEVADSLLESWHVKHYFVPLK